MSASVLSPARFAHLEPAMDGEAMGSRLQRVLLEGSDVTVEACAPPKVHVAGDECRLQYGLRVRGPSGARLPMLVLGTMFADRDAAAPYRSGVLSPLAARWHENAGPSTGLTGVIDSLGMAVSVYPVDGRLPTLVDAACPGHMTGVLPAMVGELRAGPVAGVDLVRYNRTHGAVLRYRIAHGRGTTVVYGKVGCSSGAEAARHGLQALARRSSMGRLGSVIYPELLGHSRDLDLIVLSAVPGKSPGLASEAEVGALVRAGALVAAAVHTSAVGVAQVRSLDGELGRARSGVEQIGRDAPLLAQWLAGILDDVAAEALSAPPQEPVLSHGDFTPSQLLFSGRRVALLDFDGLCAAEPAFDLGRFLAYLRVALLKSGHPARDGLAAGFLGGYHRAGGPCAPERRVELYGLVSLVLMAVHSCQRLKPARVRLVCDVIGQCRRSMGQPDAEASERRRASGLTATGEPQARSRGASEAASA